MADMEPYRCHCGICPNCYVVAALKADADSANRQWERAKPHLSADLLDQIQQLEELRNEPLAELRRRITNQRRELKKLNKKLMERGQ